ncbi:MAG: transglycosylase domain-containing protein [Caldilineaceae bacterium]|nr:transglycosylase domain-containing protein [Caldilineaceae bacterium]
MRRLTGQLGRRGRFALLSLGILVVVLALAGTLAARLFAGLPAPDAVESRLVRPTTQIFDRHGRLLYETIDPNAGKQINLDLTQIPQACVNAVVATEDARFFYHPGVDPIAVARAAWQYVAAGGEIVSGASTITQQLARNILMGPEERYDQSPARKLREQWLALRLERRYTKDEILALYLNQTYFGNWAFGLEAAAQVFFAKPARQLSTAECALLAGLIQHPTGYNPLLYPETAKARQLTVLRLMREARYLDDDAAAQVAAEPLQYRSNLFAIKAPHFVMYVQDLLADQLGVDRLRAGGLRVYTTLDLGLQEEAEAAVRRRLDQLNCRVPGACDDSVDPNRRVDNAAAVVLDSHTGDILAMVGSPDYFDATIQGNVNAALSLRQPGSAIKPLTYAAALDPDWSAARGQTPLTEATVIADLPTTFYVKDEDGGNVPYAPLNYDRTYHGPVSVRTALANSYNIPAVKVLDRIGVETLQQIAGQAGISTFGGDFGLALTLGGGEVKLLELTAAFGVLDDGKAVRPRAIGEIEESRLKIGETTGPDNGSALAATPQSSLFTPQSAPSAPVIDPATAYILTDILSDRAARQAAFGAGSVLDLPFPAAAKTGTTTDWRDNWTIGYTTERIVGVWVGNADNTPMLDVSGIDGAGPIWRDIMLAAHPVDPPGFTRPPNVTDVEICGPSGMLPTPACTRVRHGLFVAGTEPTAPDTQFQPIAVDTATGRRATANTPAARRQERVYWVLPPEYHDWMVSQNSPGAAGRAGSPDGGRQHRAKRLRAE